MSSFGGRQCVSAVSTNQFSWNSSFWTNASSCNKDEQLHTTDCSWITTLKAPESWLFPEENEEIWEVYFGYRGYFEDFSWMISSKISWYKRHNKVHSICTHCAGIACSTFAGATEYLFRRHIYVVRWRHFSRSRISLRHRITSRRRFSKTLFPQPNFSPPPNYLAKTLFEDTFPAAEFAPATELPTEDAFRRHFSRSRIYARHRIVPSEVKKNNTARATDQRYCTVLEGDDQQKKELGEGCAFL